MSWKNFLSAGLLCVLASPVFAVGPDVALVKAGTDASLHLDATGNWVWMAQITPDMSIVTGGAASGTPIAAELGFTSTSSSGQGKLVSTSNAVPANFDYNNPGTLIFSPTWETTYGTPLKPEGLEINCATGSGCSGATNTASLGGHAATTVTGTLNQIFASLGSVNFTTAGAKDFVKITVSRPITATATADSFTTITISGAYNSGKGRIAQISGTNSANFDTFGGASYTFSRKARAGDTNLDGSISFADYSTLSANFEQPGTKRWQDGDYNGDGTVSFADYSLLSSNFEGPSYTVGPPPAGGAGLGSGGAVPEPASIALLGLALLGGLGVIRRKR